jgi:hypothetical protein
MKTCKRIKGNKDSILSDYESEWHTNQFHNFADVLSFLFFLHSLNELSQIFLLILPTAVSMHLSYDS